MVLLAPILRLPAAGSKRRSGRFVSTDRRNADRIGDMTDATDARLIALLTENARAPVAQLAQKLGLARSTVQARLDRLERAGVIAGYTLRLSDRARGGICATVLVQMVPARQAMVLAGLRRIAEVETVHTTSGRFDLACRLRAGTTEALDDALDRIGALDGVKATEALIHLSTRIDRG
ncbi:AsnC family transcriptional regulator [Limimaricola cinnabarinus]|uniref:AsnC family transcriptional regulator n=2 Tax=Limimaricola cinnabarinus TaxID=1125964 RepID=A0A2G1MJQ3_9RHOB|nr:AsnC family transcriptional regulator [Limimaricola cinnabarinus]